MVKSSQRWVFVLFLANLFQPSSFADFPRETTYDDDAYQSEVDRESKVKKCETTFAHAPSIFQTVVEKVVDGDTVKFSYKGSLFSIRFLGIDTPETNFQVKGKVLNQGDWAFHAKDFMGEVLPVGTKISIQFEGERCDGNGRILAYVYRDKIMINRLIIENALAVNYCIFPNFTHCVEFGQKVEALIEQKKGMFSDSKLMTPYVWRKMVSNIPMDKYVGSMKTKKVYPPKYFGEIPIGERIFFFKKAQILPPFKFFPQP